MVISYWTIETNVTSMSPRITTVPQSSETLFSVALHAIVLIEMLTMVILCSLLLVKTMCRPMSVLLKIFTDKPVVYILCCGGILQALHILPVYITTNPIWRSIEAQAVTRQTAAGVCFIHLGLFHLGFCLFYMSVLLELYRLTERTFKVQHTNTILRPVLVVIATPTIIMVVYFFVWYFFYQHDPRFCLHSRHHDYLVIVENVVILASLHYIIPVHKIHPYKDSLYTYISLIISFLAGVALYTIRVSTEGVMSTAVYSVLSETHAFIYVVGIVITNIHFKHEIRDVFDLSRPLTMSFSSLSLPEIRRQPSNEDETVKQTMFRRSLRKPSRFIPTPDHNPDLLPPTWY